LDNEERNATRIGVSLANPDMVGGETHETQIWEERVQLPIIATAREQYEWLIEEFERRSASGVLPRGMPPTFTGLEVKIQRKGDGGYILFSPDTSVAKGLEGMPNIVKIE
jgi:hypothetical protein